jgi:acetoin utilization deacetylase AcuC-like enzyme
LVSYPIVPQLRFLYHKGYNFNRSMPLVRQVHGSVLNKPAQIRRKLMAMGVASAGDFESPGTLREDALLAIHSKEVVAGWRSAKAIAAVAESPPMASAPAFVGRALLVKPQLRASAGTQLALRYAHQGDWVFNLSGGFHHARPALAHGFCLMNDVAWGLHCLQLEGHRPRVLVLDLDLHQGDGNAAFFAQREDVFTASLHQEDTFPEPKGQSDFDLGLPGGEVDDERYLSAVEQVLAEVSKRFEPELIVYVAGTDPFAGDIVGNFDLSADGLVQRDLQVARYARALGVGLVVLPAGGYSAASPELTANGFAKMASEFRGAA